MADDTLKTIDERIRRLDDRIDRLRQHLPAERMAHGQGAAAPAPSAGEVAAAWCGACVFVLLMAALVFEARSHALSGVPWNHIAVREDGRYISVPRGGAPIDQRPQHPMTAEQYGAWQRNGQVASLLGLGAVMLGFVVIIMRIREGTPKPHADMASRVSSVEANAKPPSDDADA